MSDVNSLVENKPIKTQYGGTPAARPHPHALVLLTDRGQSDWIEKVSLIAVGRLNS